MEMHLRDTGEWENKPDCPDTVQRSYVGGRFTAEVSAYDRHTDSFISYRVFYLVWETRNGKRSKIGGGTMLNNAGNREAAREAADSIVAERAAVVLR